MFNVMKINEAALMAKVMASSYTDDEGKVHPPVALEDVMDNLQLVDRMLTLMRSKSLLNKKRGIKRDLDGLLSLACR
jgi:hypothetical protein